MISIEEFFYDDPTITPENPWRPLPKHSLEQSPCYPIIGMHNKCKVPFYYCKSLPHIYIHLESIEHHCKCPFGKVGTKDVSVEQGYESAKLARL
jgi:hypothetical protein